MEELIGFMASRRGRWVRIVAGAGLLVGGLSARTPGGARLAAVGLVPLLSGALDVVLLGPLLGFSWRGAEVRRALGQPEAAPLLHTSNSRPGPRLVPPTLH
ncbi:DUF2892 domain-containing protein [Corallococcus sp. M34]|uniref:YgaP family membrane protein n=1 Tax=Citreicoccus inhibens TaxID=2849499 RepID=UPI0013158322|nr:DUF2892 domain-containing protein [Citreicoccus inhibens]MBU8899846.1 DUF2892 domain-containing protein [Citreicoccus inhibens]